MLPRGSAANTLRGAFGLTLRRQICRENCPGTADCPERSVCPYVRIFEPNGLGDGPGGLHNLPRPFVFRTHDLEGRTEILPGESFRVDVHIFDTSESTLRYFSDAFDEMGRKGFGSGRGRARLLSVSHFGMTLPLGETMSGTTRLKVTFLTPTDLKADGHSSADPVFSTLFARARDRVSTLRAAYGDGPLVLDFREMGLRASSVRTVAAELLWKEVMRRSSRTNQTYRMGGYTGEVIYEGDLDEFLPILEAARWTGVGRQAVWGKGVFDLQRL